MNTDNIKYDKKKKQWYYEQNVQFDHWIPLGKAVPTDNGTYQYNSDGTKTIVEIQIKPRITIPHTKENIFNIDITANNELLSNGKPTSLQQLKQELPKFIQRKKTSHVIRINADKDSQYEQYFRLQNIIMLTYRQLRNDYLKQKYNTTLVTSNEEQIEEPREYYPQRISEDIIQEEGDNK